MHLHRGTHWGVLSLLCITSSFAQTARFEGQPIVDIQYSPPPTLDPADLASVQPLKKGGTLHASDVAEAIDGLFSTGRFADIAVEAEPSGNGVIIRFVTKTQWFVGGVDIEGNIVSPPNRGELHSNAQFTLGAPFEEQDVTNAVNSLTRLLKSNGLYEAQIKPTVERNSDGQQVFLKFDIRQGKRAKYEMPVITGNALISTDAILRATGWRIPLIHWWRQVTDSRTRKGVQGLLGKYQKQDRLTAKVNLGDLDYDAQKRRVRPHLAVDPGPKIKVTTLEAKVSQRVLKRYVPIFQERAVDNDLLVEGRRNLTDYFQSQGYYDVDIEFRVLPQKNDEETIEYVIAKGERHKLVRVSTAGNRYFGTDTIRERMFMAPAAFNVRHGRYSEAFRRKDEQNISELYKSNGFRDVKVSTIVDDNYKGKTGDVAVTVNINEGPQWLVDKLTINGMTQIKEEEISFMLSSTAGQPFAEVNLATDRNAVLTYYYTHGFPAATFKASWQQSGTPNHVNVFYQISEGARQYVREVITSGNHITRQNLIDKTITLHAGDPLSPVAQTDIQKQFYDLGIFARVDTAIENPDGATNHKYVLYNFEEANRYTINVGLGAQVARFGTPSTTSLSAPAGTTGFSPEISLDVSRLNFLGRGHTVSLRTLYSSIEKRASISYLQPRFRDNAGRSITYTLLYDDTLNVRTFASRREEASVQLSQQFSKSLTGLFRFAYRRVSVSSVIIPVLLIPQFVQPVRIGILSANLVQDRRNNASNPSHGIYNTIDIGLADKVFGSQRNFGRVLARNATYYRLTPNLILARQTQFGVIAPFSAPAGLTEQQSVPLPERFFGGGADSLRSFAYNQAGPRDIGAPLVKGGPSSQPTGFPLGGNALFFNNVELRFPLIGENIQGVFFHDMGNVFSSIGNISFRFSQKNLQDFDYTTHAAGFGIRYRTPVGPIRVDLAYSINPPSFYGFSGTPAELLQCNPNANPATQPGYCTPTRQNTGHFQFFFSIGQTF
ncbi:MAG TPA: BamA/TamA family outer membrane protein [Bryobacteraceae bacterium]|nr:BamA/TamA family outer membrane protein [Bryobacteraceae bacterium]